jgi:hypothetical protein
MVFFFHFTHSCITKIIKIFYKKILFKKKKMVVYTFLLNGDVKSDHSSSLEVIVLFIQNLKGDTQSTIFCYFNLIVQR